MIKKAEVRLDDAQNDLKIMEMQLFEVDKENTILKEIKKDLETKSKMLERELKKEREYMEKDRSEWVEREQTLLEQVEEIKKQNVSRQRRNTVSASTERQRSLTYKDEGNLNMSEYLKVSKGDQGPEKEMKYSGEVDNSDNSAEKLKKAIKDNKEIYRELMAIKAERDIIDRDNKMLRRENKVYIETIEDHRQIIEGLREENESFQTLLQMQAISGKHKNEISAFPRRQDSKTDMSDALVNDDGNDVENKEMKVRKKDEEQSFAFKKGMVFSDLDSYEFDNHDTAQHSHNITASKEESIDVYDGLGVKQGVKMQTLASEILGTQTEQPLETKADMIDRIAALNEEVSSLKTERNRLLEESKATSVYINKLLEGVLSISGGGLEVILDRDFDVKHPKNSQSGSVELVSSKADMPDPVISRNLTSVSGNNNRKSVFSTILYGKFGAKESKNASVNGATKSPKVNNENAPYDPSTARNSHLGSSARLSILHAANLPPRASEKSSAKSRSSINIASEYSTSSPSHSSQAEPQQTLAGSQQFTRARAETISAASPTSKPAGAWWNRFGAKFAGS
ncbi:hypothetical protein AX774_g7585 [Zancudomyces culisetae]|uniref:Uncharacterized protein n=1 Tax=Zancudomyces culisetae TaxID=1213189 RepID=A0A1R1PDR6_ZANCU|nr:hypothetical protein AX774_g7585 [Zancudomyces culisetae]|eukprot:OMH79012.1 hypothetical protein AX774_g7585 [Zancudomyces culisetae]